MAKDYTDLKEKEWAKIAPGEMPPRNTVIQAEMMQKAHEILKKYGLKHWLSGGELVNIYRDGKLQPHNQDIDFACFAEDIIPLCNKLIKIFIQNGFDTRAIKNNSRLNVYYMNEHTSIQGFYLKGKYRWLKQRKIPAKYFSDGMIAYNGIIYPCLSPIEKYLSWRYLNWKKEYKGNTKKRNKYINKKKLMGK